MPVIVRELKIMQLMKSNAKKWNSNMEVFESAPPSYSETELLDIAKTYFNKTGKIKPLVSERDQNARLIDGDNEYVIKVANSAENISLVEFQNAVLNHIAAIDPDLAIPKVIVGKDGQQIFQHNDNNIRLITFLKGDIFGDAPKSNLLYENLGKFLGRFSMQCKVSGIQSRINLISYGILIMHCSQNYIFPTWKTLPIKNWLNISMIDMKNL